MPEQDSYEREVFHRMVQSGLTEQRRARRWGIFFKSLAAIYMFITLFFFIALAGSSLFPPSGKHTALINIQGVIAAENSSSADNLISSLQKAFKDQDTEGVILRINSPGGSPVQAGQITDEIYRLRAQYPKVHLYVVVDDICASGGYYIASAAEKIFVDKASLVGSIGVRMDGFGYTGVMSKLGVERRSITAGSNKSLLDPFLPAKPEQTAFIHLLLSKVHQQFIDVVRKGRGNRLKETPDMFSGLIWNGQEGIEMGLVDGFGTVGSVARDIIKAETIVDYSLKDNFADRIAKRFGVGVISELAKLSGVLEPMGIIAEFDAGK